MNRFIKKQLLFVFGVSVLSFLSSLLLPSFAKASTFRMPEAFTKSELEYKEMCEVSGIITNAGFGDGLGNKFISVKITKIRKVLDEKYEKECGELPNKNVFSNADNSVRGVVDSNNPNILKARHEINFTILKIEPFSYSIDSVLLSNYAYKFSSVEFQETLKTTFMINLYKALYIIPYLILGIWLCMQFLKEYERNKDMNKSSIKILANFLLCYISLSISLTSLFLLSYMILWPLSGIIEKIINRDGGYAVMLFPYIIALMISTATISFSYLFAPRIIRKFIIAESIFWISTLLFIIIISSG